MIWISTARPFSFHQHVGRSDQPCWLSEIKWYRYIWRTVTDSKKESDKGFVYIAHPIFLIMQIWSECFLYLLQLNWQSDIDKAQLLTILDVILFSPDQVQLTTQTIEAVVFVF